MPLTVLVIDDQPLEGEMISFVLAQHRPDAAYAGQALNASDGIDMAAACGPDLIFLDIKMPGMDGLTAISHLRRASPGAQIVMLTAFDDFEYLRAALRAGARDYLLKPVRPADILAALDEMAAPPASAAPLPAPAPEPPQPALSRALTQAILSGDCAGAEQRAREYLASYGPLDSGSMLYVCVRCMELASELASRAGSDQSGDGLNFLYQELVREVSTLREPDRLPAHFLSFARRSADLFGHTAGDVGYRQVAEAKQYIAGHLHESIQLSEVAKKLYLSTAYFSRLFKEKTGMTFSDYLAGCRVERARQLLATTDLSIAEVSAAIGYQEANSFSRLFKARTGQSPSDYRSAQREE